MRMLEETGEYTRGSSRTGADPDFGGLSFDPPIDEHEIERDPRARRRLPFVLRLFVAIVLMSAAITLFPGPRPDRVEVAQNLYVRAGVAPTPTSPTPSPSTPASPKSSPSAPASRTPIAAPTTLDVVLPPPFLVDYVAISELVARVPVAEDDVPARVEPEIPPVEEWVDSGNGVAVPDLLLRIRFCESTNSYQAANPRSTASGAYQFLTSSWAWYGHADRYGAPTARQATPAQQDEAALLTIQRDGFRPWAASRSCWTDPNINPRYAVIRPPATTTTPPTEVPTPSDPPSPESSPTTPATEPSTTTTVASSSTTPAETTTTTTAGPPSSTVAGSG